MNPASPVIPNSLTGITLKILSVTSFVVMSSLIKSAGELPLGQIVFFRSFFALFPILLVYAYRKQLTGIWKTSNPVGHVMRGLVGICAMGLTFFALTRLPLPEAITLNYAQPLLVVIFSALILRETIRIHRWSAVVVGLIGVFIISIPKFTLLETGAGMGSQELLGVFAALGGAAASAIAMILVRKLVHTEKTATIVIWFSITGSVAALLTIPFGWSMMSTQQWVLMISSGIFGGIAQLFLTEAYRHAEASTVAPFEYTSMILAIASGYFLFGDVPTIHMLVGGAIVVGAGLFIIWRERQLGIERREARKASSPQ
ncbi:DMT family transporter [Mesorhizobium sp. SB112]|uniref:DMT family transporter n=1 Tax=Mesorhizobium sp. SB112 TaxID=3151853 RepID=UPI00326414BA